MSATSEPHTHPSAALFVGDDLALDFANSAFGIGDEHRECLSTDAEVIDWLRLAGLPTSMQGVDARPGALLEAALTLRESALGLLKNRKAGRAGDITALNRLLSLGNSYQELVWGTGGQLHAERRQRAATVEALLLPVAEAVATLLVEGDFNMVRQCESADCTLWFYDRTKSHRRRWCSMSLCGNRMKVAAFRARKKSDQAV
ncbi:CGNR zinc finger domain-containing protein [Dyella silvatica]|uniref:CGNR zinc finger domain-containing protein n=1 Tax=Dyella silvatica TaxID=2992128 RepID=UPI00225392E2|nr:CGNR zinc finger domain-containing protein [Dyella silvatica]